MITSMDSFIDQMISEDYSALSKALGSDFFSKGSYPKVNIRQNKQGVVIEAAVPGMKKEDISIQVSERVLTISGKSTNNYDKNYSFLIREIKKSSFSRSFYLSDELDYETFSAEVKDGLLMVSVDWTKPKQQESKVISIDIK
jgi:HSP20 family protein